MKEQEKDSLENMKPPDASAVIGQIDEILTSAKPAVQERSPIDSTDLGKSGVETKVPKTQSDLPMVQNKPLSLNIAEVVESSNKLGEEITTPENKTIILKSMEAVKELKKECEAQGLKK